MFYKLLFSKNLLQETLQSYFSDLHLTKLNVTIYFTVHKQSLSKIICLEITGFPNDAVLLVIFTDVSVIVFDYCHSTRRHIPDNYNPSTIPT
jgi:hypothetical protein